MKTAVIILGHGSRSAGSDETVKRIAAEIKMSGICEIAGHAFLQYVKPDAQEALEQCVRQNAEQIIIVPFFMQSGAHVTKDIPALLEQAKKQHPGIDIQVTDYVGAHPLMKDIVLSLIGSVRLM